MPMDALEHLGTLPIGWQPAPDGEGWLAQGAAWLADDDRRRQLGAVFWFDLLGKVAHLRGAGAAGRRHRCSNAPEPRAS